jgi:hypothetical protein
LFFAPNYVRTADAAEEVLPLFPRDDSTDLSLCPLSAWRLSTSHCAPLMPSYI